MTTPVTSHATSCSSAPDTEPTVGAGEFHSAPGTMPTATKDERHSVPAPTTTHTCRFCEDHISPNAMPLAPDLSGYITDRLRTGFKKEIPCNFLSKAPSEIQATIRKVLTEQLGDLLSDNDDTAGAALHEAVGVSSRWRYPIEDLRITTDLSADQIVLRVVLADLATGLESLSARRCQSDSCGHPQGESALTSNTDWKEQLSAGMSAAIDNSERLHEYLRHVYSFYGPKTTKGLLTLEGYNVLQDMRDECRQARREVRALKHELELSNRGRKPSKDRDSRSRRTSQASAVDPTSVDNASCKEGQRGPDRFGSDQSTHGGRDSSAEAISPSP